MNKKIIFIFVFVFVVMSNYSFSQGSGAFSISGGPIFGWNIPQINDLNSELKKIGYPQISTAGQFVVGGAGYMEIPVNFGLKIGGMGMGFSTDISSESQNTIQAVSLKYTMGGISVEYVKKISKKFDYTLGSIIGIGSFGFKIHKYPKDYQYWNISNFGIDTAGNNNVLTNDYSKTLYIFQPQIGIGYQLTNFLYLKLNAGYMLTFSDEWKINEILEVKNVPSGIKADGFSFLLGLNFGLFPN